MATTDNAAVLHEKVIPFLCREFYGEYNKTHQALASRGHIQVDALYEDYEAMQAGGAVESVNGYDVYYFNEHGEKELLEIKFRSLTDKVRSWGVERSASLTPLDTKNKIGDIIMGVYNPYRNTFDRFRLPLGEGYQPGRTVTITYSLKKDDYNKMTKYLISSSSL